MKTPIKTKMKHRTVGPRKGTGAIDPVVEREKSYTRLELDKDEYEKFIKGEREPRAGIFRIADLLRKR